MNIKKIVAGTVIAAVILFFASSFFYVSARKADAPPPAAASSDALHRADAPVLGPIDAPVTLTEFFDPACEACRAYYPRVKELMAKYPTQLRVLMRYAPFHNGSKEASQILEAARLQGKFTPVLEALFETQQQWSDHEAPDVAIAWQAAGDAGLDLLQAREDVKRPEVNANIERDIADLVAFSIKFTPTFFVNGQRAQPSPEGLEASVDAAVTNAVDP